MFSILNRWLVHPLFRFLNIKVQPNQGILLASSSLSGLMYAYSNPMIVKEVISSLPPQWLSIEAIWCSIATLIIGMLWKGKPRLVALKNFALFAMAESILAFTLSMILVFVYYNVWIFAVATLLYSSVITNFVCKCIMMFKSRLWLEKSREEYDNTDSVVRSLIMILGFGVATFMMPSLKVAIAIWGTACIFDDVGWIVTYRKTKQVILTSKEDGKEV